MSLDHDFHLQHAELLTLALSTLEKNTGVIGRARAIEEETNPTQRADARITLRTAGQGFDYLVECKSLVDRKSVLASVKAQLENRRSPSLLITSFVSAEMAEHCRSIALKFIETAGNVYLNRPGLHVFVKGQTGNKEQVRARAERGSNTPTGMRMIFALLCQPSYTNDVRRRIEYACSARFG